MRVSLGAKPKAAWVEKLHCLLLAPDPFQPIRWIYQQQYYSTISGICQGALLDQKLRISVAGEIRRAQGFLCEL